MDKHHRRDSDDRCVRQDAPADPPSDDPRDASRRDRSGGHPLGTDAPEQAERAATSIVDCGHDDLGGHCVLCFTAVEDVMRTLLLLSPFIVVNTLAALLIATWREDVLEKHRNGDISIQWTRAILGMTLALVVTFFFVAVARR